MQESFRLSSLCAECPWAWVTFTSWSLFRLVFPKHLHLLALHQLVSQPRDGSPLTDPFISFLNVAIPQGCSHPLQPWRLSQVRFPGLTLSHAGLLHLFPWSPASHSGTVCDSMSSSIQRACFPVSPVPACYAVSEM